MKVNYTPRWVVSAKYDRATLDPIWRTQVEGGNRHLPVLKDRQIAGLHVQASGSATHTVEQTSELFGDCRSALNSSVRMRWPGKECDPNQGEVGSEAIEVERVHRGDK